MIEDITL